MADIHNRASNLLRHFARSAFHISKFLKAKQRYETYLFPDTEAIVRLFVNGTEHYHKKKAENDERLDVCVQSITGIFKDIVSALRMPPRQFDAYCLKKAISHYDIATIVEILFTQPDVKGIKKSYLKLSDDATLWTLKDEIRLASKGDVENLLVLLLSRPNGKISEADRENVYLSRKSHPTLTALNDVMNESATNKYKRYATTIKEGCTNDDEYKRWAMIRTIVRCSENETNIKALNKAFKLEFSSTIAEFLSQHKETLDASSSFIKLIEALTGEYVPTVR